jgi:hypothetical protein
MNSIQKVVVGSTAAVLLLAGSIASADSRGEQMRRMPQRGWEKQERFYDSRDANASVEIKANGTATVRGAKVIALSGGVITATETLGNIVLTWTVNTDGTTKFQYKGGKAATLATVVVGDTITFSGPVASGSSLVLKADVVRDVSKTYAGATSTTTTGTTQQTVTGVLQTLPGSTLPASFTMNVNGVVQTVNVAASANILNAAWNAMSPASFVVGDSVQVLGYTPSGVSVMTAVTVRDLTR